jgi:hypothetical protein
MRNLWLRWSNRAGFDAGANEHDWTDEKCVCENVKGWNHLRDLNVYLLSFLFMIYSSCQQLRLTKVPQALPFSGFHTLVLQITFRAPWTGDRSVATSLSNQHNSYKRCRRTSIRRVGLEPTTPMSEEQKTLHAFEREAIVIATHQTNSVSLA